MTFLVLSVWLFSVLQHAIFTWEFKSAVGSLFHDFTLHFPLWHLNIFLFGILCGKYVKVQIQKKRMKFIQTRVLYVISLIVLIGVLFIPNPLSAILYNGLLCPFFFLIIAGFSMDYSFVTRLFGNKKLVLLGNASYALYILQWPFYIVFLKICGTEELNEVQFLLYLLGLISFSILVYNLFEKKAKDFIYAKWINS